MEIKIEITGQEVERMAKNFYMMTKMLAQTADALDRLTKTMEQKLPVGRFVRQYNPVPDKEA